MTQSADRFDIKNSTRLMHAVVTLGNGGYEQLNYRQVPVPEPKAGEVLLKVLAAGMNNTEINTRLGWYSSSVTGSTEDTASEDQDQKADGGWNKATPFPFIQGTDCCGEVVQLGQGVDEKLEHQRVLVRACMRPNGFLSPENIWLGSDFDGAFAQFVKVPAGEVFPIQSEWSDAELATIPCAYGTAENMLHRCNLVHGETVVIAGASGGVGSAAVQLAKRRGANVVGIASAAKHKQVAELGCDRLIDRNEDIVNVLGQESVDLVVDNVAGDQFPAMLEVLKRRGRYTSSGAIAGPIVNLDMRTFYLKDITLVGCTGWDEPVFPNLVSYIERSEIQPLLAKTFGLKDIAKAQKEFLEKKHTGNFVLIPWELAK